MNKFATILAFFIILTGIAGASSVFPLTINSNTIYQNTNTTSPLYIYSITNGGYAAAYIGPTNANLTYVLNGSIVLSGVIGATLNYQIPMTLIVPPGWYYEYNYSASENFEGMYLTSAASTSYSDAALMAIMVCGVSIYLLLKDKATKEREALRTLAILILIVFMVVGAWIILVSV